MLIPIKIICGCGQKYAFDVTPVNSRMPGPVQCPRCGADGTAVANAIISLALGVRPASNLPAQQNAERLVATRDVPGAGPGAGGQGSRGSGTGRAAP